MSGDNLFDAKDIIVQMPNQVLSDNVAKISVIGELFGVELLFKNSIIFKLFASPPLCLFSKASTSDPRKKSSTKSQRSSLEKLRKKK